MQTQPEWFEEEHNHALNCALLQEEKWCKIQTKNKNWQKLYSPLGCGFTTIETFLVATNERIEYFLDHCTLLVLVMEELTLYVYIGVFCGWGIRGWIPWVGRSQVIVGFVLAEWKGWMDRMVNSSTLPSLLVSSKNSSYHSLCIFEMEVCHGRVGSQRKKCQKSITPDRVYYF